MAVKAKRKRIDVVAIKDGEKIRKVLDNLNISGKLYKFKYPSECFEQMRQSLNKHAALLSLSANPMLYDLEYFLYSSGSHSGRLVHYQENKSGALIWPGQVKETLLGYLYHDGYQDAHITLISSQEIQSQDWLRPGALEHFRPIPCSKFKNVDFVYRRKPALFLDRDGIINRDIAYLHEPDKVSLVDGIEKLIAWARAHDFYVIVLTNQAGVARGMYSVSDVERVHQKIDELLSYFDQKVDAYYVCYFFEKGTQTAWTKKSLLRKPNPGLLFKACYDFPIDITRSFMIGDKISDALNIPGLRGVHLQGEYDLDQARWPIFYTIPGIVHYLDEEIV